MKIENIKKGMVVKNYKELCELLDIKVRNGGYKKKQIEEFRKYFEWEKDKNSFVITKVYNKPKAFTEQEMIELMILNLLANAKPSDKYSIIATKRSIFEQIHMTNRNFRYCLYNPNELATYKNINEELVVDVVNSIDRSLDNKLNNALETLSNKKILISTDVCMICKYDDAKEDFYDVHKIATDKEVSKCLEKEMEVLKKLNCERYQDVLIKKLQKQYSSLREKAFDDIKVKSFYKAKKLIFVKSEVPKMLEKYLYKYKLSQKNYNEYKIGINKSIQNQTNNNAQNRHENAIVTLTQCDDRDDIEMKFEEKMSIEKKCSFGNPKITSDILYEQEKARLEYKKELETIKKMELRADYDYMKHVDTLINILIDGSTKSLITDIQKTVEKLKNK